MRPKVIVAVLGLVLTLGGVGALTYGLLRISATPAGGDCSGNDCLADPWVLGFPLGIVAIVLGLIIAAFALGSLRQERGASGPLRAFGFMSGLGGVFVAMGAIFLATSRGGDEDGTFLFVGALFGVMGLAFIGIDLIRFRGELKKDRLRVSGLKGTARVVGVRDTNVTVNNSPLVNLDLEVTVPGQPPFRTNRRTVISRLSVGALMPGAVIAVLADPAKPRDIVLDWDAGTIAPDADDRGMAGTAFDWSPQLVAGMFQASGGSATSPELLRRVSQALAQAAEQAEHGGGSVTRTPDGMTVINGGTTMTVNGQPVPIADLGTSPATPPDAIALAGAASSGGIAGSAPGGIPLPGARAAPNALSGRVSLDTIADSGVDIAGNRLYTFDLTVSVAGRQPYQVKHASIVPKAQVPRLLRGASFPAQIDPAQPAQITVAWDR